MFSLPLLFWADGAGHPMSQKTTKQKQRFPDILGIIKRSNLKSKINEKPEQ